MPLTTTTIDNTGEEHVVAKASANAAAMRTAIKAVGYENQALSATQIEQARKNLMLDESPSNKMGFKHVCVVFVDDDSPVTTYSKLRKVLGNDAAGLTAMGLTPKTYTAVPGVAAVIADATDGVRVTNGHMTIAEAQALEGLGWEIALHCANHISYTTIPIANVKNDMELGLSRLRSYGLTVRNLVYPYGGHNEQIMALAANYFDSAFVVGSGRGVTPFPKYSVPRQGFSGGAGTPNYLQLATWQNMVTTALGDNLGELICVMLHSGMTPDADWQVMIDFLEWLQTRPEWGTSLFVTTIAGAIEKLGTTAQGQGLMLTNRRQQKYTNPVNNTGWAFSKTGEFHLPNAGNLVCIELGTLTNASPVTSYPDFRESLITFSNAEGVGKGFPTNSGHLKTVRLNLDTSFHYQEFRPYGTYDLYMRRWNGSSWSVWTRWSTPLGMTLIGTAESSWTSPGELAAGARSIFDITVTGASPGTSGTVPGDMVIATPARHPEAGLVWNVYIYDTNTVRILLTNASNSAVTPATRTWRVKVMRDLAVSA